MAGRPARSWLRPRNICFVVLLLALVSTLMLLRLSAASDYLYHATVKDPPRTVPSGPLIVSPADGTVIYVKRVENGVVPEVVKRGVPVPVIDLTRSESADMQSGWLIGIYMNTFGVHVNRMPEGGTVESRHLFNGPHMDMSEAETKVILKGMIPGLVSLRRVLGLSAHGTDDDHDFVTRSARETLVLRDARGNKMYIVRIADYYVGKILTWVDVGQEVERGQKMGLISWGSQTDLFIEDFPGLKIEAVAGEYVYGGESVLATY